MVAVVPSTRVWQNDPDKKDDGSCGWFTHGRDGDEHDE